MNIDKEQERRILKNEIANLDKEILSMNYDISSLSESIRFKKLHRDALVRKLNGLEYDKDNC